jgi:hypothetical protein
MLGTPEQWAQLDSVTRARIDHGSSWRITFMPDGAANIEIAYSPHHQRQQLESTFILYPNGSGMAKTRRYYGLWGEFSQPWESHVG